MRRLSTALVVVLLASAVGGCFPGEEPDVDGAAQFDRFPIYWLGETFEGHGLEHISELGATNPGVMLVYGTCDAGFGYEARCNAPLQIQVMPLCTHLDAVARNQVWRTRKVRGAPVGTIDGAPVLFTRRMQLKVYRGEGSDRGMPRRAFEALRSLNSVEPVIAAGGPIPPPPPGVLEGERFCSD